MKRLRTLPLLLLLAATAVPAAAQKGKIVFEETKHTFDAVEEGEQARHVFTFRNEGEAPLRVLSVRTSCGCTSPDWTREPVAPGQTGTVAVVYNSKGRPGPFRRSVAVVTDGEPEQVSLYILGDVRPPSLDEGTAQGNLLIEQAVVDLGTLPQGQDVWHTFRMQNKGLRPIRLQAARTPADNLQVRFPEQPVASGDVVEVNVLINTSLIEAGQSFDYAVVLATDDELQPEKSLRLKGTRSADGGTH